MEDKYAVLIDAENVSPRYIDIIFDEASNYGVTTYRRIYGDWTSPAHSGWKEELLDNSITPVQQYSYTDGKNASDSAMIIDAMDILYTGDVDGFVLVSSDSDFTRLASRIRESGRYVIGMGESKTPSAFIAACNSFKYLDIIYYNSTESKQDFKITPKSTEAQESPKKTLKPKTSLQEINGTLRTIINENSDDDDFISLADLGNYLNKRHPDFDVRNYGHGKLVTLIEELGNFKIERRSISKDGKTTQVYVKNK